MRKIEISTQQVFDSADAASSTLFRIMNLIHIPTRAFVVQQELTFATGQPYDAAAIAESARNLRALGIFRAVDIDTVRTPDPAGLIVHVNTHDAWTTNPQIKLQTSGTEATVGAGLRETNFLGTNTVLNVAYERNPDRSVLTLAAARPRLVASTVGVDFNYEGRSDGTDLSATVSAPFFHLSTPASGSLNGVRTDIRVLQFRDGNGEPFREVRQRSDALIGEGGFKISASESGYLRAGLDAQIRRDGFQLESDTSPFPRPVTAAFGPWVEYRHVQYLSTRGYEAFGRDEDVDLGLTVRLAAAIAPGPWGYPHGGIGPSLTLATGQRIPVGFVLEHFEANGLLTSVGVDSGAITAGVTAVFQAGERHMAVLHADGGVRSNPYPGEEFDLGLGYGARAYPAHAFTGDRYYITSAEYRYIIVPNAFGLYAVGLAAFVDQAGAWFAGSPARSGTDAGLGLRFGSLRSPTGGMIRIDLAFRAATSAQPAQWVIAVGKGFAFDLPH